MATIADAHIYFWLPFHGYGVNYVRGQNSLDDNGSGSWCSRKQIRNTADTLTISDVAYAARGITSGAVQVQRQSDIGVHYYDIKQKKIQALAPTFDETFTFWFRYNSSSITSTTGTHHLISTDNYSIDVTFDQTTTKAKINGITLEPNRWYHVAIVHETIENKLYETIYLNGGEDGILKSQISVRTLNSDNLYLFGKGESATNTPMYTYYISDFRWYGIKLTSEEILEKGTDRLILHYTLDHIPKSSTLSNCSRAALYGYHVTSQLEDSETPYHYQLPPSIYNNSNTLNAPYEKSWDFVHSSEYYFIRGYDIFRCIGGSLETTSFCIWYKPSSRGLLFAINERNTLQLDSSKGWLFETWNGSYSLGGSWGNSSTKFHHLAVIFDFNTTYFYWDGELKKTLTWTGGMYPTGDLHIGHNDLFSSASSTGSDGTWRGYIADFRMYSKKLSEEEIQTLSQHPGVHLGLKNNNVLYTGDLIEEDAEQVEVKPVHNTIRVKDFIETENNEVPSITKDGVLTGTKLYER